MGDDVRSVWSSTAGFCAPLRQQPAEVTPEFDRWGAKREGESERGAQRKCWGDADGEGAADLHAGLRLAAAARRRVDVARRRALRHLVRLELGRRRRYLRLRRRRRALIGRTGDEPAPTVVYLSLRTAVPVCSGLLLLCSERFAPLLLPVLPTDQRGTRARGGP